MIRRLALVTGLFLLGHSTLTAQSLSPGTWTGSVTPIGEESLAITYDVSNSADSLTILIRTPDRGDYPVSEAKLSGDTLTFRFQPGPSVQCRLAKQEGGSFVGECVSEGGMSATMVMTPPAKPAGPGG